MKILLLTLLVVACVGGAAAAPPQAPLAQISREEIDRAIDKLGSLDFPVRTEASRTVRRAPPSVAVPALVDAAAAHKDGYTRFRALVLLTGFNDGRAETLMLQLLTDPNDRVRAVAYGWFGEHRNPKAAEIMLAALDSEASEFVRPSLTRALAMYDQPNVRQAMTALVTKGQDFFRSVVIEALGDQKAAYAQAAIAGIARLDGPLQDDAVLALGKIGDKSQLG
nr:HEAT repeat domain-containing protein [Acidobacteriota bacterium]